MFIYTCRKEGDTNEKLIKQAKKNWNNCGKAKLLRSQKYWKKDLTKRVIRTKAIKRTQNRMRNFLAQFTA